MWRSFSFDENTETMDAYVTHIRQVAALLDYGEPQILEVFKNTLPTKLYWILYPIEDLREAVETAKRILTKEKLDRQLTRQTSSTPFMSIRDGHNRKVSFDTKEELGGKIDKLVVMIGKLATRDSGTGRRFKPQIHQSWGRGQNRNYNQGTIRTGTDQTIDQIVMTEDNTDKTEVGLDMNRIIGRGNLRGNMRSYSIQNSRGEYRNSYRNDSYDRNRNRSRERSFSRNYHNNRTQNTSNSRSRSGSRASTNRDRI